MRISTRTSASFLLLDNLSSPLFCLSPLGDPVLESGEVEEEEHDEELRQRVVRKLGAMDTRVHPCVPKLVNAHSSCNPTSFTPSLGTHFPFHVTASPVPAAPSSSSSSSSSSSPTAASSQRQQQRLFLSRSAFSFFVENLRNFLGSQRSKFSRNYQLPSGYLRMVFF